MESREHSITREGTATGVVGAALVAIWYFVCDVIAGSPFRTPSLLGQMVFQRDFASPFPHMIPEELAGVTVMHVLVFVLAGIALTFLIHLSTREPSWRMGVWIGLVVAFGLFAGMTFMLTTASGKPLPLWSVLGGTLVGLVGMAWYLWRRHPRFERSFQEAPLGSEETPPRHPPAR